MEPDGRTPRDEERTANVDRYSSYYRVFVDHRPAASEDVYRPDRSYDENYFDGAAATATVALNLARIFDWPLLDGSDGRESATRKTTNGIILIINITRAHVGRLRSGIIVRGTRI